jgi:hypothetical protein
MENYTETTELDFSSTKFILKKTGEIQKSLKYLEKEFLVFREENNELIRLLLRNCNSFGVVPKVVHDSLEVKKKQKDYDPDQVFSLLEKAYEIPEKNQDCVFYISFIYPRVAFDVKSSEMFLVVEYENQMAMEESKDPISSFEMKRNLVFFNLDQEAPKAYQEFVKQVQSYSNWQDVLKVYQASKSLPNNVRHLIMT